MKNLNLMRPILFSIMVETIQEIVEAFRNAKTKDRNGSKFFLIKPGKFFNGCFELNAVSATKE